MEKSQSFIKIADKTLEVEIADDAEERSQGLMKRTYLSEKKGMFFIHEKSSILNYWMKNMEISIDIIFIDNEFNIVKIYKTVPPCEEEKCITYSSEKEAKYVLEVQAGFCEENGVGVGDVIEFHNSPL